MTFRQVLEQWIRKARREWAATDWIERYCLIGVTLALLSLTLIWWSR